MNSYDMTGVRGLRLAVALGGALALAGCDTFFGTSPDEYLSRGVEYYQEGDLAAAAIEFRNVLQENPEHARARYYLGVTELQTGEFERARRDLERAAELGHPQDEIVLPLAEAYSALGQYQAVLEAEADEGMGQAELAQWYYLRGRAALQTDDLARAREEFRQALLADPASADARFGQVALARERGKSDQVRTWVERTLAVDENHAGAWRARAMIALQDGRRDDAEDALDRAIANDNYARAGDLLRRGLLRVQRGALEPARSDAETLAQRFGNAPWGPYLRGLVALREGDLGAAQSAMEEAISRTDAFAAPRLFLAAIHGEEGRHEQAKYQLDRYDSRHENDPVSRLMRVALEFEKGNEQRARALLDEHIEANPGDQRALAMRRFMEGDNQGEGRFVQTAFSGLRGSGGDQAAAPGGADEGVPDDIATAPESRYQEVVDAINASNYGEALDRVESLLEEYPNDPELYNLKGGVHVAMGDLREGVEAFRNALQRDPDNVSAVRNLGQVFEQGGREDVALALYRQAHENNPESLELTLGLARLEARQGNDARVETLVDEAIIDHPDAPQPRLLKARHALLSGDPETALDTLEPIRAEQTDNPAYMRLLGEALMANDQADLAADAFERAQALGQEGMEVTLLRSRALVAAEEYDAAAALLRDVIGSNPDAVQPRVLLMRLLGATGDHEGAEAAYQDLLGQAGEEAGVFMEGGRAAMRAGNLEEAIERFERARELQPSDGVLRELADAYRAAGDPDRAHGLLEQWASEQGLEEVESATLHLLAQLRQATGSGDPVALYERLVERNPDDVVALNNLAWNLRESKPQQALSLAERARELAPDAAGVRHTLAMTLAENGRVSDAITHLEEIVGDDVSASPTVALDLADLYLRDDRPEDARPVLETLAETDFQGREQASERLRSLP